MDRGAWRATVHRVTESQTRLSASTAQLSMVLLQKMATRRQPLFMPHAFFFFKSVNSLLFSIGIEWISDVVFVLGVQELDSVIHRCLFSLELYFFAYRSWQCVQ